MATREARVTVDITGTREYRDLLAKLAAAKAVLADRERELLDLKGPCSGGQVGVGPCRLHYAHSGPCDPRAADHHARLAAGTEWVCGGCGYHNNGGICTHCGQVPLTDHPGECPFPDDSCRDLPTCPAAGTED